MLVRWRHRIYFALLVVVGVVIAVGAHPYDTPTPVGAAFKHLSQGSSVAFALRSTGRAVPLVILGFAGLLGAGTTAAVDRLRRRERRRFAIAIPVVLGVLLLVNLPALWTGSFYGDNLQRPEEIPQYWKDAAKYLDSRRQRHPGARAAGLGLRLVPLGPDRRPRSPRGSSTGPTSRASSSRTARRRRPNLLNAFDLRLQDRKLEPGRRSRR